MQRHSVFVSIIMAASLALGACAGGGGLQKAPAESGPPAALTIYYPNTAGKVGHHTVMDPRAYCGAVWNTNYATNQVTGGQLPPGLEFNGSDIQGIPQIPGDWVVRILFTQLECQGKTYPDYEVTVRIHIEGERARRVE